MAGIGSHTKPNNGKTNDWITPRHVLTALGDFDLDPCACEPMPWKTAEMMLTKSDDGLATAWFGRVWLNPPYGTQTGTWMERLANHGQGTALIFARTETEMFWEHIWKRATAILFLTKRLWFCRPDGSRGDTNAGGPSCLVAYGERDAAILAKSGLQGALTRWDLT